MSARLAVDRVRTQANAGSDARRGASRGLTTVALVSGLVTLLLALLLPVAPVMADQPVVSWPQDPARPQPTLLTLTAYQPLGLQARFSCRTARLAGQTEDGVVLATADPRVPAAVANGLVVTNERGTLVVRDSGTVLVEEAVPGDGCSYRIEGTPDRLTITRDRTTLVSVQPAARELPEVEALTTSVVAIPGGTDRDLTVRVDVDNRFSTTPTPLKLLLLSALGVTLILSVASAVLFDRRGWRSERGMTSRLRVHLPDLVVVGTIALWAFLAPMTDDDGYYSSMARNYPFEGYVGNYQQLFNHAFTPYTWFYVLLSKWQAVGLSPVVQRVPALVCGLVMWLLLRLFLAKALSQHPTWWPSARSRRSSAVATGVLALTFLIWFLPHAMGVRPEPIVAVCAIGALVAVAAAIERESLTLAALAVGIAGVGFATHTTGFIAIAPLLAGTPALWRLARVDSNWTTAARALVIVAPAALASVLPFADGSLSDFIQAQKIFLESQDSETWYSEYRRYEFLLRNIPMGSYAKRAAVLLSIVGLIWFVILNVAARARQVPVPMRLQLSGWTLGLGFMLLWLTPSKWTHHFGAMAGIGAALLGLMLIFGPSLVRDITDRERLPVPVLAGVFGSVVLAMALAGHGPNDWPYSWLLGMPHAETPPQVWIFRFDQPLWWALGLLLVGGVIAVWGRQHRSAWRGRASVLAVPIVVLVFIVANLVYLVGSFGLAAVRTWDTWSLWASNLQDPLAATCSASNAVEVLDEKSAEPLPRLGGASAAGTRQGFVSRDGWPDGASLPIDSGSVDSWGSFLLPAGGSSPTQGTGEVVSPWYEPPAGLQEGSAMSMLVAGRLGGGNVLRIEYGRFAGEDLSVIESTEVGQEASSPAWRSILLAEPGRDDERLPDDADAVRLVAVDGTTDEGGWLAVTAPTVGQFVSLQRYIPEDAPVGVSWRIGLLFPCQRQARVEDGITEPIRYAVSYRGGSPLRGMVGGPWQAGDRGGLYGKVSRTSAVFQPTARLRDYPEIENLQVFRFSPRLPDDAYKLTRHERRMAGW